MLPEMHQSAAVYMNARKLPRPLNIVETNDF